ncbi:MAG: ATP synthase F1 subunit gamma [Eubacterium sp.]|nr:ATP synthase F1 subunit gamma [Eubacterium sp.]
MANLREIKNRIQSVQSTQKITNAMYLIASTKLQKARADQERTRPYFELQKSEMKRIFQRRNDINSHYFYPETGRKQAESYAYLVVTADKGLAGAYNTNVLKLAEGEISRHKKTHLFVVGEYGRQYFMKRGIPIEKSFLYTAQNPTFRRARRIAEELLALYNDGTCDEIRVIYSHMERGVESKAERVQLLPFERGAFGTYVEQTEGIRKTYEFYPNPTAALENIVPSYIAGYIYGALVESFCSEQNARMNAMKAANDNAEELLGNLSIQYNRVRQAAITSEITEVAAGAKAQRRKRRKKHQDNQST